MLTYYTVTDLPISFLTLEAAEDYACEYYPEYVCGKDNMIAWLEMNIAEEVICENDCWHLCLGCDKRFCEIKTECNWPHYKELPDTVRTNAGDYYCGCQS